MESNGNPCPKCQETEKELEHSQDQVIKLAERIRAITDIVKGPPPEDGWHSTHDVVECVQKLQDTKDALYQELNDLFTHKAQIEILQAQVDRYRALLEAALKSNKLKQETEELQKEPELK